MASQGNSQSSGSSSQSNGQSHASGKGVGIALALGSAALAGVLLANASASRDDAIPTHPSAPIHQQMAFLPSSSDRLMRRTQLVGSTHPAEETAQAAFRRASFEMPNAKRWNKGVQHYSEVRPKQDYQIRTR